MTTEATTLTGGKELASVDDTPNTRRDSPYPDYALVTATLNWGRSLVQALSITEEDERKASQLVGELSNQSTSV